MLAPLNINALARHSPSRAWLGAAARHLPARGARLQKLAVELLASRRRRPMLPGMCDASLSQASAVGVCIPHCSLKPHRFAHNPAIEVRKDGTLSAAATHVGIIMDVSEALRAGRLQALAGLNSGLKADLAAPMRCPPPVGSPHAPACPHLRQLRRAPPALRQHGWVCLQQRRSLWAYHPPGPHGQKGLQLEGAWHRCGGYVDAARDPSPPSPSRSCRLGWSAQRRELALSVTSR